jgi:small subunit ribosomal protein S4
MDFHGPKVKMARQLGIPLTPKASKVMQRKPYPPGQQGAQKKRGPGKMSNFKKQLREKQKLRAQYHISEKQMRRYFKMASRKEGNTEENLIQLLERRLDAVVHRSGLAKTIYAARMTVGHGHIFVNGKRVNIPSFLVRTGDVVTVKEASRQMPIFQESVQAAEAIPYVEMDPDKMEARMQNYPAREDVPVICEISQVVEYYSR